MRDNNQMPTLMAGDVPGRELMRFIREKLCEKRMLRWGAIPDSELRGMIPNTQYGSVGFAVRRMDNGNLAFTVSLSARFNNIRFRGTTGEDRTPDTRDADQAGIALRGFFRELGFRPVRSNWFAWDEDLVEYNVETDCPACLGEVREELVDRRKCIW